MSAHVRPLGGHPPVRFIQYDIVYDAALRRSLSRVIAAHSWLVTGSASLTTVICNLTTLIRTFRTCLHKKYMWIFEHNFVADKAKIRRRAVARQVFFTQDAAKFAEKTLVYACEDRF